MNNPLPAHTAFESARPLPPYYGSLQPQVQERLHDFDSEHNLGLFESLASRQNSKNFVLDFGMAEAWCGFDFEDDQWQHLLQTRSVNDSARWIQIWRPHQQPVLVKRLAREYGLSPRLTALISTPPHQAVPPQAGTAHGHESFFHRLAKSPKLGTRVISDEEKEPDPPELNSTSFPSSAKVGKPIEELDHYDIADAIWHLQSVDVGPRFLCLGYNSFYNVKPNVDDSTDSGDPSAADLPHAQRIWHWVIICDDNMVVSITEGYDQRLSPIRPETSATLRHHLLSVFLQLSLAHTHPQQKSISLVPIRKMMRQESSANSAAGLLLYYLFDDWTSTYGLFARRENAYSTQLIETRRKMMQKADLRHVEQLHRLGRQMAVLRRVYQGYHLLIDKVLDRHKSTHALNTQDSGPKGTYLSPAALDRFERLADRISLYVLTEIEESITLKDQLLNLNFNLITIKQATSVERLTRITILLAKVTILVLPVTLMTGYFSVQILNTGFTIQKYWISFAVILAFSFLGLLIFGWISRTVEGGLVYQSFTKAVLGVLGRTGVDGKKKGRRD